MKNVKRIDEHHRQARVLFDKAKYAPTVQEYYELKALANLELKEAKRLCEEVGILPLFLTEEKEG